MLASFNINCLTKWNATLSFPIPLKSERFTMSMLLQRAPNATFTSFTQAHMSMEDTCSLKSVCRASDHRWTFHRTWTSKGRTCWTPGKTLTHPAVHTIPRGAVNQQGYSVPCISVAIERNLTVLYYIVAQHKDSTSA